MMDNDQIAEQQKINLALDAGLMDGISAIKAERGEVLLFDVQTNSLVGGASLKDSGEGHYFIQEPLMNIAPPVILPAAIYLTIMQANGNPDDVILENSNTTLEYIFSWDGRCNKTIIRAIYTKIKRLLFAECDYAAYGTAGT